MSGSAQKAVTCFSSAADVMRAPEAYFKSPAFAHLRWTMAGEQRNEAMREFCRKLLRRLDGLSMPFYPVVGLMSHKVAAQRYVTGADPWPPSANPYLDGDAIEFRHCILSEMPERCWYLFAEIAFDVARLAQTPVMWGGFSDVNRPGMFRYYAGAVPDGFRVDKRTYGSKRQTELPWGSF